MSTSDNNSITTTTSDQRISTKGRIAPTRHPRGRRVHSEKQCFRHNVLPLQTSLQTRAAAGMCCLHSQMHFNGGDSPQNCPFPRGDPGTPSDTLFLAPTTSPQVDQFSHFCTAVASNIQTHNTHRQTDHTASSATGNIFALCAMRPKIHSTT